MVARRPVARGEVYLVGFDPTLLQDVELASGLARELPALWLSQGRPEGFAFSTRKGGPLVPQNVCRRHLKPLPAGLDATGAG